MIESISVTARPLRPEDADAFLRFFDHERGAAFSVVRKLLASPA